LKGEDLTLFRARETRDRRPQTKTRPHYKKIPPLAVKNLPVRGGTEGEGGGWFKYSKKCNRGNTPHKYTVETLKGPHKNSTGEQTAQREGNNQKIKELLRGGFRGQGKSVGG